jgi:hypothetical protein
MKRIFVSLSLMLTVGLTTLSGEDNTGVNDKIKDAFKKEFAAAELLKWQAVEGFQMATFILFEHRVIAFFNQDGELLGSFRNILSGELPMVVISSLDRHFAGADIIEIRESCNRDGTTYLITIEVQNKRYNVKTNTDGDILRVSKVKKWIP